LTRAETIQRLFVMGQQVISSAEGNCPVNALERALRKGIGPHYTESEEINLCNYKVRGQDGRAPVQDGPIKTLPQANTRRASSVLP
jgi:hypothetical protein